MPIIQSAKKRVRIANKAAVRNSKTKRSLRSALKAFQAAITTGDKTKIAKAQVEAQSAIDTAAKKNVIHKNKAARKKSQLATQAKSAGVTATKKKPAAKKPTATKTKPAAKKAPAKKKTA